MRDGTDIFLIGLRRLLAQLSERALSLDPQTAQQFQALAGQVIEIHCLEPDLTWHLVLGEDHVDFHAGPSSNPNVAITGSPKGLLQTLLSGHSTDPIEVDGDATLLMQLQALASAFNPDLVRPLANVIGNDKAQRTAAWLELWRRYLKRAVRQFGSASPAKDAVPHGNPLRHRGRCRAAARPNRPASPARGSVASKNQSLRRARQRRLMPLTTLRYLLGLAGVFLRFRLHHLIPAQHLPGRIARGLLFVLQRILPARRTCLPSWRRP